MSFIRVLGRADQLPMHLYVYIGRKSINLARLRFPRYGSKKVDLNFENT